MADGSTSCPGKAIGSASIGRFYVIALSCFVVDQTTKLLATSALAEGAEVRVLGPVMSFTLHHNTGAAWGLLAAHTGWLTWVAASLALLLAVSGLWAARVPRLMATGLPLLLGGALGNLTDRLRFGAVVDFIDFHIWPVFNVADIVIVAGALLVAYQLSCREAGSRCDTQAGEPE